MVVNHLPYKQGSSDLNSNGEITPWGQWFARKFSSYAAKADGYYGSDEVRAVSELQRRVGLPITGVFDVATARHPKVAYPGVTAPKEHRPIWFYSAPGSGAAWDVGPSWEVGKWVAENLNLNHQPIGFPIGGYMGLMGGDPSFSYNDVIAAEGFELERLIASCPDIDNPNVEFWFSAYSQSADGLEDALERLFGDGGRFAHLRSRINGVLNFGNPSRQPGPTKVGNNPPGWGIARKVRSKWLADLVWSITNNGDFYGCADDEIRPLFYAEVVKAKTSLPFFVHVMKIALPVIGQLPFVGPLLAPILALAGPLMSLVSGPDEAVDVRLTQLLSLSGLLQNIPALFTLLGALPGIQIHGEYWMGKPEFGGRSGIQVACDVVRNFRR